MVVRWIETNGFYEHRRIINDLIYLYHLAFVSLSHRSIAHRSYLGQYPIGHLSFSAIDHYPSKSDAE